MKQVKALVIAAACLVGLGLLWNSLGANALLAPDTAAVTPPADDGRFSRAELEYRADAPSIYSLLAHLQEEVVEPTNTPALPQVTNTPARPEPEPTNTPAPPQSRSTSTIEGAPTRLRAPQGIEQDKIAISVAEQQVQDEEHVKMELERAEQLRRAGVRFQVTQPETGRSASGGHQSTGTASTDSSAPAVEGENCFSVAEGQSLTVEPAASDGGLLEEAPDEVTDQETLYPVADATVLEGVPTQNFGGTIDMWAGYEHCSGDANGIVRSLVRFDVSGIPAGVSIEDATLRLYLMSSCDAGERTHEVTVYRTSASWSESSVTWSNQPGFAGSYGSAWIPSRTWGWYSFDVTDLVQGWVGGSFSNHGLMVRGPESSGTDSARLGFFTRDYQDDPALRPQLVVEYTTNRPPYAPSNPSPADGAMGVSTEADLSWTGGDPDSGDTVTYDVYFEANDSTPDDLLCNDVSTAFCDPGTLAYDTPYTWYVVASDDQGGSTTGPTWDFTTGVEENTPPSISGLPDQEVPMNGSADDVIDLWAFADDAEDADNALTFTISNSPAAGAGVTIDGNRYIDINPDTGWTGHTEVEIQVEDSGGLTDRASFNVTVGGTEVTVSVSGNQFCAGRSTGVKRCFDVEPAAEMDATVRFYFSEEERNEMTLEDLLVFHYVGEWMEEAGPYTRGGAGDGQYVEAENVDDFSRFALDGASETVVYLPLVVKR